MMSHLCWKSRYAFRTWKAAGRPRSGQLYDERRKCKCNVQRYLNRKRANQERRQIQKHDDMFSQNHPQRFRSGNKMNHTCKKFAVNNLLVTNTSWRTSGHVGRSLWNPGSVTTYIKWLSEGYPAKCLGPRSWILLWEWWSADLPFNVEEVEYALKRLRPKRSGGPDNLLQSTWSIMAQFSWTGFAKFKKTAFVKSRKFQHVSSRALSFRFSRTKVATLCSQKVIAALP